MATKFTQNEAKLDRFQFCKKYGNNFCVYSRVFSGRRIQEYATENFKGANTVAMATKFGQK